MADIRRLVKKAKNGDKDAFVELMQIHRQTLYKTAVVITKNEDDALDALSDTVLACWEKIPALKNENYFKTWITKILVRKCCDILKRQNRYIHGDFEEAYIENDEDTRIQVKASLDMLSDNDRMVLMLFYFQDYSVKQISEITGISQDAVKARLSRGRKRFEAIYKKEGMAGYEK